MHAANCYRLAMQIASFHLLQGGHVVKRSPREPPAALCFVRSLVNMLAICRSADGAWGMDELVDRIVAKTGVDRTVAEKAVAIILDFLAKEGPEVPVRALLDQFPGADAAIAAARSEGSGMFGAMGGIMAVGSRLMAVGLDMAQIQSITRELIAFAREKAGDEALGGIVDAIPGLSQFI